MKIEYITKHRLNDIISKCVTVLWDQNLYYLKTYLYLVFYTGIKNQEVYSLKKEYVDLEHKKINLPNRTLYLTDKLTNLLRSYLSSPVNENNIFNLNRDRCMLLFNRINYLLPHKKTICMDVLRNSYGMMLAKKKVPLEVAKVLMGINMKGHIKVEHFYNLVGIKDKYVEAVYRRKIK